MTVKFLLLKKKFKFVLWRLFPCVCGILYTHRKREREREGERERKEATLVYAASLNMYNSPSPLAHTQVGEKTWG
jgi:hypothetical protein